MGGAAQRDPREPEDGMSRARPAVAWRILISAVVGQGRRWAHRKPSAVPRSCHSDCCWDQSRGSYPMLRQAEPKKHCLTTAIDRYRPCRPLLPMGWPPVLHSCSFHHQFPHPSSSFFLNKKRLHGLNSVCPSTKCSLGCFSSPSSLSFILLGPFNNSDHLKFGPNFVPQVRIIIKLFPM